jgi:hypothetical protein
MMGGKFVATDRGRALAKRCREIVGSSRRRDGMRDVWAGMSISEREFWLGVSRQDLVYANFAWSSIPGGVSERIKNNLNRAAMRAGEIMLDARCNASLSGLPHGEEHKHD